MGFGMSKPEVPSMPKGGKGKKAKKGGKPDKPKKAVKAKKGAKKGKSRYEEAYGEDYEEDFTEERVMSYAEEYTMVPGTYMTESYMNLSPSDLTPAKGQSASLTKTGKPVKPPTAGVSPYNTPFGGNADDAMDLSPMVEHMASNAQPMNFAVFLLTILFIVFVMMRK